MRWICVALLVCLASCGGGGGGGNSANNVDPNPSGPATPADDISLEEVAERFEGLSAAEFFDVSYQTILSRYPELVVEVALELDLELDGTELNNISMEYRQRTTEIIQLIKDNLESFDKDSLTANEQLSFDIYAYYLDDWLSGESYIDFEYPGTNYGTSVHWQTLFFFTDVHPLEDVQDMEHYVARLDALDDKLDQLIVILQDKEASGILAPAFAYEWAASDLRAIINSGTGSSPYYLTLEEKSESIPGLSSARRDELLASSRDTIEQSILPAYERLVRQVDRLADRAPADGGVSQYAGGAAFYQNALQHHTTTDLTAADIHALGLAHLDRVHGEIRAIAEDLGYPADETIVRSFQRIMEDDEMIPGGQVVSFHESVIQNAYDELDVAFTEIPASEIMVIGVNRGGYYLGPSADGARPGAFYASSGSSQPRYQLPSLTYHETVPGHHLQIATALERDLPLFRRNTIFTAYTEGWALYAERLAYELGWYAGDPRGNLGRLQYEAYRAARLVVDTGIHDLGWGFDQASQFFRDNTGFSLNNAQGQIFRYMIWPGQATAYMTGMLRILGARERAQVALAETFDLSEFHQAVLQDGSVPLDILDSLVDQYIESKSAATN
jgi:uncharacterized protein (DUF885 family)